MTTPRERTLEAMLRDTLDVLKDVETMLDPEEPRARALQYQITAIEEVLTASEDRVQTS